MPNPKYPRGSEWRKWDLHVHTPASHVHSYPGEDPWEVFLQGLEGLPPEFKVIGISDYLFIDGYKRVLNEKANGRLANIDLVLPVIELRLDKFGGSPGHLSRVNYHVIFSNEIPPEVIEQQFLNALCSKYVLFPQYDHIRTTGKWAAVATKQSLIDLGKLIIDSVPEGERNKFGDPFIEGFNSLCISRESIHEALESHYFNSKYLTAVGKTEWADIKWNDHSIAEKKNIINGVDFVFISAETVEAYTRAKRSLVDGCVNSCLLDCSDAHAPHTAEQKDRLGKCITWIKADPTFQGLRQIINEPDDRIFVGTLPPSLERVKSRPTRVVKSLSIKKCASASTSEKWFDCSLVFNPELVAIIGNKGNCKSALADVLGLLGNTPRHQSFSFLKDDRFRDPKNNKARNFEASLLWADDTSEGPVRLDQDPYPEEVEKIRYIPQNYLEEICNEVGLGKGSRFYAELQQVIFSHVPEAERLEFNSLDELLEHRGAEVNKAIQILIAELRELNKEIVGYEERLMPRYRKAIKLQLAEKRRELQAHEQEQAKPKEVTKPEDDPSAKQQSKEISAILDSKHKTLRELEATIADNRDQDARLAKKRVTAEKLIARLKNLQRQVDGALLEAATDFNELGLSAGEVVSFKVDAKPIERIITQTDAQRESLAMNLDPERIDSLEQRRLKVVKEIEKLQDSLTAPQRAYQEYLHHLREWEAVRERIHGSSQVPGSIAHLEMLLTELDSLPQTLRRLVGRRNKKALEIFREKQKLRGYYESYYGAVQNFLVNHPVATSDHFKVTFNVAMVQAGFAEVFLGKINQRKVGSFAGVEEGAVAIKRILDMTDWDSALSVLRFTRRLIAKLKNSDGRTLEISEQLKQGVKPQDLYDFIFSFGYLSPIYRLSWEGKGLEQLSPGERGNLLLIFYLLVDQDDIPLVIDQPEENLDNQTVVKTLVPGMKYAKRRRQIVVVTHNPNLAVVCDAEQVIYAELRKELGNKVDYISGSIEDPAINKKIIDVLEGTRPAFDKRDSKYLP